MFDKLLQSYSWENSFSVVVAYLYVRLGLSVTRVCDCVVVLQAYAGCYWLIYEIGGFYGFDRKAQDARR